MANPIVLKVFQALIDENLALRHFVGNFALTLKLQKYALMLSMIMKHKATKIKESEGKIYPIKALKIAIKNLVTCSIVFKVVFVNLNRLCLLPL